MGDPADLGSAGGRLTLFQVLEARVKDFFHAMKFRPPDLRQVFGAAIDLIEPRVHVGAEVANPCVHLGTKVIQARVIHQDTDEHGERRNGDGHGGLKSKVRHFTTMIATFRSDHPDGVGDWDILPAGVPP